MHTLNDRRHRRDTVALAGDVDIMRTHIPNRGHIVRLGMLWGRDVQSAKASPSGVNPAMQAIDVTKEGVYERGRGMLIDLLWRAALGNRAVMQNDDAIRYFQCLFLIMRHEHTGHMEVLVQTA